MRLLKFKLRRGTGLKLFSTVSRREVLVFKQISLLGRWGTVVSSRWLLRELSKFSTEPDIMEVPRTVFVPNPLVVKALDAPLTKI